MSEGPKLYTNKPKKAQLKQFQEQQQKSQEFSSPSSSSSSMGTQSPAPPPQQPPKESFARRYKFLWPMLLAVNLAVGAKDEFALKCQFKKKKYHIIKILDHGLRNSKYVLTCLLHVLPQGRGWMEKIDVNFENYHITARKDGALGGFNPQIFTDLSIDFL